MDDPNSPSPPGNEPADITRRRGAFEAAETSGTDAGANVVETPMASAGAAHPGHQPPATGQGQGPASGPGYATAPSSTPGRRRSLLMMAVIDTLSRPGARLGLAWIAILATLATFAPFLASSHPLLVRWADGRYTSPLLQSLDWVDVALIAAFFAALALLLAGRMLPYEKQPAFSSGLLILVGVTGLAAAIGAVVTNPPTTIVYEQYREAERAGEIEWSLNTIVPYSANDRLNDRPGSRQEAPSANHWLGTTIFGEDMLSRMIHATRTALAIGFVATGIAAAIGITVGSLMGYFARTTDLLLMRFIEITEAIPQLILLLIVTAFYGKNIWLMMIVIGLISWTSNARFIRAEFLKLRKQDFVQAGIAAGLPLRSLLFRHMLPNGIAPVLVNVSFGVASAILLESILSFLGLGLEAEDPSWGQLLNQARSGGTGFNWWIATFPGLAIFLTVFAYILIGEAMRDAIDPKMKRTTA